MKSIIETKRAVDEIAMKLVREFLDKKMNIDLPQTNEVQLVFYVPMYKPKEESIQTLMSLANQVNVKTSIVVYIDYDPLTSISVVEKLREISNITIFHGERHVGQLIATNVAGKIAQLIHGDAVYYALASDHDFWHPYFAQRAIESLEKNPKSIIWIPRSHRIETGQGICKKEPYMFHSDVELKFKIYCQCNRSDKHPALKSLSSQSSTRRILASHKLRAGDWIYGVHKGLPASELYLPTIGPDQIYLQRLLCRGSFAFDNSFESWIRVQNEAVTRQRSIRNLFPEDSQILKKPLSILLYSHRVHHLLLSLSLLNLYRSSNELRLVLLQFWILFRVVLVAKSLAAIRRFRKYSSKRTKFIQVGLGKLKKRLNGVERVLKYALRRATNETIHKNVARINFFYKRRSFAKALRRRVSK